MTRSLPRRMLVGRADRSTFHRSVTTYLTTIRTRSTLAAGAAGLLLPVILGVAPVLPAGHTAKISAPAARLAAASLAGAIGDPVGIGAEAEIDTAMLGWSGTLAFGDPTDPATPADPAPPADTPADGDAPDGDETTPTETGPGAEAAPPPAADAQAAPAVEVAPEAVPAPAEVVPAPQVAAAPEAAPAEAAPAEAAPAPEAAPAAEAAAAPVAAPVEDEGARLEARGIRAADIARTLVGSRYRYGAAGPRAFDCSGLTLYIYRQLGITLPHKARSQFNARYGTIIRSMNDLKPGDLVFYKNTAGRGITHAAIYVGNGKMVTANSPRQGVRLSSIHDSYWRRHWAGGLRVSG